MIDLHRIVTISPPAKLNLFLELVARRDDGYHDIDTVMVAIDWCDRLLLRRTKKSGVDLQCDWAPSRAAYAEALCISPDDPALQIPTDESNLVCRALSGFADHFGIEGGFACELDKFIPAGAGMGGASSDAACALLAAAELCDLQVQDEPSHFESLVLIASSIGSDVPFFLGPPPSLTVNLNPLAARAQGTGTDLEFLNNAFPLHAVVVFAGISLSTATVYASSHVPRFPDSANGLIHAWNSGDRVELGERMMNRLSDPAQKLVPQIDEILESMWRTGPRTCQLTGSGSACFALCDSRPEADAIADSLRSSTDPGLRGAIVRSVSATHLPTRVCIKTKPRNK